MIPTTYYLIVSGLLFVIGLCGILIRRNLILILLSIELMLNAANLNFIAGSALQGQLNGQVSAFFVMVIAAAEVTSTYPSGASIALAPGIWTVTSTQYLTNGIHIAGQGPGSSSTVIKFNAPASSTAPLCPAPTSARHSSSWNGAPINWRGA